MYANDHDFSTIFEACQEAPFRKFYSHEGYLFKEHKLCVPQCSMRELLTTEAHRGGLMRHFEVFKTLETLKEQFY